MTTKVALYARYSSDLQSDNSIEDQIRILSQRAEKEGWSIVAPYSDHAISGASMNRPGLKMMLHDAAAGKFNLVLTEGLDRISRDQEHIAGINKRLNFAGVQIYSLSDGGIVNELHIGLKGTMNQMFLKDLAAKTHRGMKGRVENGKVLSGRIYGYDTVRAFDACGEPIKGERTINPEQAAIVQRIFEEYASGKSPRRIATDLNRDGIPSPTGKDWSISTISGTKAKGSGIINNKLYIGQFYWNRFSNIKNPDTGNIVKRPNDKDQWVTCEIPHLRVLSDALWDKAKAKQKSLEQAPAPHLKRRPKTLFSSLLKCGCCGAGFSMISAKRYGCAKARNRGTCNNSMTIARTKIENTVLDALQGHMMRPELFEVFCKEYTAHMDAMAQKRNAHLTLAKAKLEKLDTEKANLIDAIKQGIPASAVKDELLNIEAQREHTQQRIANGPVKAIAIEPNMAERYHQEMKALRTNLNHEATRAEAIELIRTLVDKITIQPDKHGTQLQLTLYGDLAGMLSLGSDKNIPNTLKLAFNEAVTAPDSNIVQHQLTTASDLALR